MDRILSITYLLRRELLNMFWARDILKMDKNKFWLNGKIITQFSIAGLTLTTTYDNDLSLTARNRRHYLSRRVRSWRQVSRNDYESFRDFINYSFVYIIYSKSYFFIYEYFVKTKVVSFLFFNTFLFWSSSFCFVLEIIDFIQLNIRDKGGINIK